MRKSLTALAAVAAIMLASGVKAEDWPTRPLTGVNAAGGGGPTGGVARLCAKRGAGFRGESIVMEKVGGAGGRRGAGGAAKAPPAGSPSRRGPAGTRAKNHPLLKTPAY